MHGPTDDGTLGLPHLQKWSDAQPKRRFGWLRESLPLLDVGRVFIGLLALTIVAGMVAGGVYAWERLTTSPSEQASTSLGEIVTLHARANAAPDEATRYSLLAEAEELAERTLAIAPADQAASIENEYNAIQEDLDRLTRMVRIEAIQPVGGVPAAASPSLPALFNGGGRTYLLADALYEVEVSSAQLIQLLAPGDRVSGEVVGPLLAATWRGDGPVAVDAERAYVFDTVRGEWDWEPLGSLDGQAVTSNVLSAGVFDLNLYLLDGEGGRIMKFAGGDYEAPPEDWAPGVASEELMAAQDIVIDGNIYVLQPDGTILKFFLNDLNALLNPGIQPAFDSATALIDAEGGFYVVNASDGRIAHISEDGTLVQQFSPLGLDMLLGTVTDAVIDESTGIALLLTEDGLYTTRLVPGG